MRAEHWRILIGAALILAGLLALVNSFTGVDLGGLVWAFLFVVGGAAFIISMAENKKNWWAAIPGFTLLGIGALIGVGELAPPVAETYGGAIVLGSIGVSFLVVYLLNPTAWWAIIPAGVMFSLTAMIALEPVMDETVVIFFLGLAATFGVLALLPIDDGKRTNWPLYPAGALLIVGLIIGISAEGWAGYLMPLILIILGGYLVIRALRARA
jgi:uncharacterized membrane protein HdeD (DUF308 family)